MAKEGRPIIGLALAGGGTRASQISIGILKGLSESGLLDDVRYLSTVSGGSYAGYWFMSQKLHDAKERDMFRDCIPHRYSGIAAQLAGKPVPACSAALAESNPVCICPSDNLTNVLRGSPDSPTASVISDPYRYQNHLRGHTDLFVPTFSYADTGMDRRFGAAIALPIIAQLATAFTVDLVGDVLFDWNVNSSPSRYLYREGIRRIYGSKPIDCAEFLRPHDTKNTSSDSGECDTTRSLPDELKPPLPTPSLTFKEIRDALAPADKRVPFWIINATTPVLNCPKENGEAHCVPREFFSSAPYPAHKATFEFAPDYWGSGEFGYWPVTDRSNRFESTDFTVTEAVASSAAFFDPNEKSITAAGFFNVLQQATGFKWGYYLRNPMVSTEERALHRLLFFPLYLAHRWRETKDAVDIHLIDGGQSENLGAYALIRRRVPNIIISDHAGEITPGNMEDVCKLRRSLKLPEFARQNNNRIWHIHFDDLENLDSVCGDGIDQGIDQGDGENPASNGKAGKQSNVYNIWNWKHPVVRGCAVEVDLAITSKIKEVPDCASLKKEFAPNDPTRHLNLFLIKPALDLGSYAHVGGDPSPIAKAETNDQNLSSESEIRGFIAKNQDDKIHDKILRFPAHGTVRLTIDSSPWIYGAYRELAAAAVRMIQQNEGVLGVVGNPPPGVSQPALSREEMEDEARKLTDALK
ncbi:MAG: hypothetical protein A2040_16700 [Rhodocyclales bacterium GWA2_65_19]|nr:MAG: hypothetical protein A2040_16700 [Rhodocyclales bacterium GWA2_65_19]